MIRWYPARRQPRRANARRPGLLRDARGATMIEYLIIVVVIALVAASAFSKFDGAVRTALKSEPEKATKLDGDDGQRNGPTAAELAEAVAYAHANQVIGGAHDRDAANNVSQHSNHGVKEAPPDKIGDRPPPRDPHSPPRDPGGPPPHNPGSPPPDPGSPPPRDTAGLPASTTPPGDPAGPPSPSPGAPLPRGTNDPHPRDPSAPGPPSQPGPLTPESPDGGLFAGCTGDRCTGENGSNCFVAGTPVLTASGPQPIEAARAGDLVVSRDEATGETALRPIARTFVRPAGSLVDVELRAPGGTETIRSTPEHPYRSAERGWVGAGALRAGERLLDARGGELRVARIERLDAQALVYNFEVAGTHTYFAGALGAWVHNDCSKDEAAAAVNEAIDRANQEIRDKNERMPAMTPEERAGKNARIDEKIRQVRAGEGEYEDYDDDEKAEEIESLESKRPRDPIPEIEPIGSLDEAADRPPLSCKDVSCTNFAGYLLEANGGDGPAHTGPIAPGDFVHVHINSPPNPNLEHSFNVYFDDQGNAYIVQAFVNHSVPVVTRMSQGEFNRRLELVKSGQPGWQQAYQELFHVDPNTLGVNDPNAGMNTRLTDPPPTNAGEGPSNPPSAVPSTVGQVIAPPPGAADAQDAENALNDGADTTSPGCCGGACNCVTMLGGRGSGASGVCPPTPRLVAHGPTRAPPGSTPERKPMDQRIRQNRSTMTKFGGAAAGAALLAAAAFAPRASAPPQGPAPATDPARLAPAAAQAPPGPAPKGLAASRAAYAQRLEELRRTRPERKRERLEEVELKYRRVAHLAGFEDELRVHVERIARLRRAGALAVAEGRSYETRTKVLALTMKELTRHRTVVRAFERRAREET